MSGQPGRALCPAKEDLVDTLSVPHQPPTECEFVAKLDLRRQLGDHFLPLTYLFSSGWGKQPAFQSSQPAASSGSAEQVLERGVPQKVEIAGIGWSRRRRFRAP